MTTTSSYSLFGFKRAMPMAAARFGAFRHLFGQGQHYHEQQQHNSVRASRSDPSHYHNLESFRHASAISSAILRNMSSSTAMGEPSQLVEDPSSSFEERHRHYSFITVLAIMSLFILITISIVALILGFCRKKNSVFALGGGRRAGGSVGDKKKKTSRHAADNVSQFELDSLDADLDLDDIETKACKDDPGGACYYQLNNDDDCDDDYDDDSIYDYDSDIDDEIGSNSGCGDYLQIDGNDRNNVNSHRSKCLVNHHKKKKKCGGKLRKAKLRFRDSKYYYHLQNDDGNDDSCDEFRFPKQQSTTSVNNTLDGNNIAHGEDGNTTNSSALPKRSITFPQLHCVLTSCIKSDCSSLPFQQVGYQKLHSSSSPQSVAVDGGGDSSYVAARLSSPSAASNTAISISCDDKNSNTRTSQGTNNVNNTTNTNSSNPQIITCKENCQNKTMNDNIPALIEPHSSTQLNINHKSTKFNVKKQTVHTTIPQRSSTAQYYALLPSKRRRRLFKSYSLHDIPYQSKTKQTAKPGNTSATHSIKTSKHPGLSNIYAEGPSSHNNQTGQSNQVTFKVGTVVGDTDIRLHHV